MPFQEPLKCIQAMAAFATLRADHLGWDSSMRLYCPSGPQPFVHSFDASVTLSSFLGDHQTRWVVEMPSRDGNSREIFVTTREISVARSDIMLGKATLVWEVVKYAAINGDGPMKMRWLCFSVIGL